MEIKSGEEKAVISRSASPTMCHTSVSVFCITSVLYLYYNWMYLCFDCVLYYICNLSGLYSVQQRYYIGTIMVLYQTYRYSTLEVNDT